MPRLVLLICFNFLKIGCLKKIKKTSPWKSVSLKTGCHANSEYLAESPNYAHSGSRMIVLGQHWFKLQTWSTLTELNFVKVTQTEYSRSSHWRANLLFYTSFLGYNKMEKTILFIAQSMKTTDYKEPKISAPLYS